MEHLVPQHHAVALRVRLRHQGKVLARPLAGEVEGEAMDPFRSGAREGGDFHRHFVRQAGVHAAAGARILAFGVLAHDHPVDVLRVVHRRSNAGQQAGRAHVGVLVEALADRQAQAPQRQMVGHLGRADRAEEDGVELLQLLEPARRNVGAGFLETLRAPVEIPELDAEVAGQLLQHFDAGRNDLVADPVAGDRRDAVGLQAAILLWFLIASATAAPTSAVPALPFMSGVCGPSRITRSIARTTSAAAWLWPRCSSISAPDQIAPIGLAIFLPAMSGAEPCTGSKIDGAVRSGLMLPEAAMPMVPAVAGPRSERMSPNRLEATITSKRSGLSTIWIERPST